MEKMISVGEMRKMVMESQNQFKPVVGKGVEKENKSNNDKSYKETEKKTGAKEVKMTHKLPKKEDGNKTMLDYTFDNDPGSDYKKRVHAQAKGYTSVAEENNDIEKNAEFADDFYKSAKEAGEKMQKNAEDFKKTGLRSRELPDETFKKENMYESKIPTVRFKRSSFLTEEHMMSKIPDEMKKEGKVFRMIDMNDNTYIVEWRKNIYNSKESGVILEHTNKKKVNESIEKMKSLYSFKSGENTTTTVKNKVYENNEGFTETLNKIRKLMS